MNTQNYSTLNRELKPSSDSTPSSSRIPIRAIPVITEPPITALILVGALWNPRGDFLSPLKHEPMFDDWKLVYDELEKIKDVDDCKKQLELLPDFISVRRTDLDSFDFHQGVFQVLPGRVLPPHLSNLVYEGFNYPAATPEPTTTAPEKPSIAAFIKENPDMPTEEKCSKLFDMGHHNNEIGVAVLGGTYRKGSNALVMEVVRLRKAYKKKLGNLTP